MRWSILFSCFAMLFAFNVEAADYAMLHGMGSKGGGDKESVEYWGGSKSGGHCTRRSWGRCKSYAPIKYNPANYMNGSVYAPRTDTYNRGWNDGNLQNTYVSFAGNGSKVIAHSMGNTILAGACYNGRGCVKWNNTQGPVLGSNVANTAHNLCNNWWWKWNVGVIVDLLGFCSTATFSLRTDKAAFNNGTYQSKARAQTQNVYCGHDTNFWAGGSNAGLATIGNLVDKPNDGLVPKSSCTIGWADGNVTSKDADHLQGTGRAGNHEGIHDWMRSAKRR